MWRKLPNNFVMANKQSIVSAHLKPREQLGAFLNSLLVLSLGICFSNLMSMCLNLKDECALKTANVQSRKMRGFKMPFHV